MTEDLEWVAVCPVEELDDESAVHVEVPGTSLCLARSQGTVHALLDECSHGQVRLSEGDVEQGRVECWLHGSGFDLVTGAPGGPPATRPVPVFPARINGHVIEVRVTAASPTGMQGPAGG